MPIFRNFLTGTGERRDVLEIPPNVLDVLVGQFIKTAKFVDKDGIEQYYEPDSLTALHRGIDRFLRENDYGYSLVTSKEFTRSKKVLETRRKELKAQGKGNKPNRADAMTGDEEEKLWEEGVLGDDDPYTLQNSLYYIQGKCYGLRGSHEARQLAWWDMQLLCDQRGREYLEWNERLTKTRAGQDGAVRSFTPKIWENTTNKARCPIELYKKFASHRSPEALCPETPFYLTVNTKRAKGAQVWYKNMQMGEKMMGLIVKKMCQKAGIKGRKTNHSIRKTMCTSLIQSGVSPLLVQQQEPGITE